MADVHDLNHETLTEVRYGETDQMGYAHHSTLVLWFELGRVHWLRHYGLSYGALEKSGVRLPVVAMQMRWTVPARFEDSVAIQTRLTELGKCRVVFENRLERVEAAGERVLLATGVVELACVGPDDRPRRLPPEFDVFVERLRANAR